MTSFTSLADRMNDTIKSSFKQGTMTYQKRVNNVATGDPITLLQVRVDVIRQEVVAPGNFIIRWVKMSDFGSIVPANGDIVTLDSGEIYTVHQVQQSDPGDCANLILVKR